MLKINEQKLVNRFWRNVRGNSSSTIISFKPDALSKWIFPAFAGIIVLMLSIVWFIHHPEIVMANGVITGTNTSGDIVYAEVDLQEGNVQKIISGQSVQIRFNEYPSAQFSSVKGSLQQVTPIPAYNRVSVQVLLTNGLTIDRKKKISQKKGLKVSLLIIVKDMRLLQHILYGSSKSNKAQ